MPDTHIAAPQAAQAAQLVAPNLYSLAGGGLHVSYTISGIAGAPHLTYQDATRTLSFSGTQIRTVDVPDLGTVVSVTLVLTVDTGSTTFSVLLPAVQLASGVGPVSSVPVSTDGITTFHRFSVIPVLNHGQREFYTVTPLTGTASRVFFFQAAAGETPPAS
jgi:hypothetical protein